MQLFLQMLKSDQFYMRYYTHHLYLFLLQYSALFDKKIMHYKEQSVAIAGLPGQTSKGWLRVDAKPVRQALSTWVTKWMFAYTQYLQHSVQDSLSELMNFMATINEGVEKEVDSEDEAALVEAMTHIRNWEAVRRSALT